MMRGNWRLAMQLASWHPHVGDRVRVRDGIGQRRDTFPHYPEEQGLVGTVVAEQPLLSAPDHAYLVRFDGPHPVVYIGTSAFPLAMRQYAATELESLGA
jgi:hypothetical protein